jgi:hypothetical protein
MQSELLTGKLTRHLVAAAAHMQRAFLSLRRARTHRHMHSLQSLMRSKETSGVYRN